MKKKIIVSLAVFLVLCVAGGLFFWWKGPAIDNFLENRKTEKMTASSKDYNILENSFGKFIIDEKDGLEVKIPIDWKSEIGVDETGSQSNKNVILYSQDFAFYPAKGCLIKMEISRLQKRRVEEYSKGFIMYAVKGAEEIVEAIDSYKTASPQEQKNMQENGLEVISINGRDSLKKTIILSNTNGRYITVDIPTENGVYTFEGTLFSDICDKEFEQFLETVSIK